MKKKQTKCSLKHCSQCFSPTHFKFNFSFMEYDKYFTAEHKSALIDRIEEISREPFTVVANWGKERGFEIINVKLKKQLNSDFLESERKYDDKFIIVRLYPHNNPYPSRIIGKLINKIFYILLIDIKGNAYPH